MQINIGQIIKEKNPLLFKLLPGVLLRWLKKLLREKEINEVLADSEGVEDVDFANLVLEKIGVKINTVGLEHIPKSGPCIIAANHPLGGVDGMALLREVASIRPDVRFVVNDILLKIPNFKTVFVGVNKHGSSGREQLLKIEEIYKSDMCTLVFPAGYCSRKIDGVVKDAVWNPSFTKKANKYNIPIVPASIKAVNTKRFYAINIWRRRFGIKANIELVTLPDEMFKQKGKTIDFILHPAISKSELTKTGKAKDWSNKVREIVYSSL
jgi:putative hemolysin